MRTKVFWVEGLPGVGKSTVISRVAARNKELVVFPKTDVVSVFAKGLNFDFRKFSNPGWDSACAVEALKRSILNASILEESVTVIGERSYLSSLVYYAICSREHSCERGVVDKLMNCIVEMDRQYDEKVILLEGDPVASLQRDFDSFSGFWNNPKRALVANALYLEMAEAMGVDCLCVSAQDGIDRAVADVEAIINA